MRILVGCTLALTLTACAASSPNEGRSREDLVRVGSQDGRTIMLPIQHDDFTGGGVVEAPRETVWPLVPVVYEELGLPAPAADKSIWTVAVQNHTTSRRVGHARMSELIDCGMGLTGAHADSHRIRLSVRTWLETVATGRLGQFGLKRLPHWAPTARDFTWPSSQPICTTLGSNRPQSWPWVRASGKEPTVHLVGGSMRA